MRNKSDVSRTAYDRLLTVAEAARRLSTSERQVWRHLRDNKLRRVKIGRSTRITENSLQDLIDRS